MTAQTEKEAGRDPTIPSPSSTAKGEKRGNEGEEEPGEGQGQM